MVKKGYVVDCSKGARTCQDWLNICQDHATVTPFEWFSDLKAEEIRKLGTPLYMFKALGATSISGYLFTNKESSFSEVNI